MTCENCGNEITSDMDELEYSQEFTAIFCDPSCAMNFYFDHAMSVPVSYEEAVELIDKDDEK